ncbi:uncharacterized protein LOC142229459 [Haematobia irritans]|uniref:uncharacterized protein LOC142229459 n=1 Tax=Haematobia irritans TaxID=7368 RepID=UPI003F4FE513
MFDDILLISQIKKNPNLFVRNSKDYMNKQKREDSWTDISNVMGTTVKACQSRWRSIRDRYVRIHRMDELEVTQWELLKHLEFLKGHVKPCSRKSNTKAFHISEQLIAYEEDSISIDDKPFFEPFEELSSNQSMNKKRKKEIDIEDDIDDRSEQFLHEEESNTPTISKKPKEEPESKDSLAEKMCDLMTEFTKYARSSHTYTSNRNEPFLRFLEQKLETLPEQHQEEIKINILNYVFTYAKQVENGVCPDFLELK